MNLEGKHRIEKLQIPVIMLLMTVYPLLFIPEKGTYTAFLRWMILIVLALIGLCTFIFNRGVPNTKCYFPLSVFIGFVLLSALFSNYQSEAWIGAIYRFTGFLSYLAFIIMFLLAVKTAAGSPDQSRKILNGWMLFASIIAVIGIMQYLGLNILAVGTEEQFAPIKSSATIGNSNHFATFMLMAFPFACIGFLRESTPQSVVILSLIYAAVLTSLCRSAWIGAAVGYLVLCYYYVKTYTRQVLKLTTLLVVVTIVLSPVNDWRLIKQAFSFMYEADLALEGDPEAGSARFLLWEEGLKALPGSLIIGTGPDSYTHIAPERFEARFGDNYYAKAHNIFLEIAVTMGIPALVSYLYFLMCIYKRLSRQDHQEFAFRLMIIIYLVQGFFLVDVIAVYPLFWVLLGLGSGTALRKNSYCLKFNTALNHTGGQHL